MVQGLLLEKYLHGELSDAQVEDFIKYLESDEEYAEIVKIHCMMHAYRAKKLESYLINPLPETEGQGHIRITLLKIIRNVAALFVLGVMSYFSYCTFNNQKAQQIVEDFYSEPFISPGLSLSFQKEESIWENAIGYYSDRKYEKSETEILKIDSLSIEQTLYLGLSKMYKQPPDFEGAITILERIKDHTNNLNKDATTWYLAVAYLKTKQTELAIAVLKNIASSEHYQKENALKALKYIDIR